MRGNTARLARGVSAPRCIPKAKEGFHAPLWNPQSRSPSGPCTLDQGFTRGPTKEPSCPLETRSGEPLP